jgi:membrane protease YdiL (CAAX protease family)
MAGILVQLFLSWIIIRWSGQGDLSVLGFRPEPRRMMDLFLFLLFGAACSSLGFLLRMQYGREVWDLNPALTARLLWDGVWYNIKSVLFEELIFRGVLFFLLIRRFGSAKALLISAALFGVYHWFTYELWGQPVAMLMIFLLTGLVGALYGYAYLRTGSLYAPIGLHFGWNFVQSVLFSAGNIGKGILVERLPLPYTHVSLATYLTVLYLPMLLFIVLGWMLARSRG